MFRPVPACAPDVPKPSRNRHKKMDSKEKYRLRALLVASIALFVGTSCANGSFGQSASAQNGLLGGWIANAQSNTIPEGASVFIGFWEGGAYTVVTSFKEKESRMQGTYEHSGEKLIFDGKTRYSYKLNEKNDTLELVRDNGSRTIYERVKMELLPADGASRERF